VRDAECNTRRTLRRMFLGLRWVPLALGAFRLSRSASCIIHIAKFHDIWDSHTILFWQFKVVIWSEVPAATPTKMVWQHHIAVPYASARREEA
jgi:hypothetical protein